VTMATIDKDAGEQTPSPAAVPSSAVPSSAVPASAVSSSGRRRRKPGDALVSAVATVVLLAVLSGVAELGARSGWWRSSTLPAPSSVVQGLDDLFRDPQFWSDAGRTGLEVGLSIIFGSVLGLLAGLLFWKLPTVGRVFEPYLVSFYAVPMVLFYPVMIVLVGINASSVVILATVMAAIPMALNTTVGLNGIRPVYLKLSRSLECRPHQTLLQIALPAAAPFIVAGLRLGVVYALIGSIAMEFTTAQAGLGYRIRYLYEIFDNHTMYQYILVVLVLSVLLTVLLAVVERVLVKGRTS
jgi:NitT/TauT family transport system permease protein